MSPLKDRDAYLARVGATAPTTLAEIHRPHATSIAFENFDCLAGRPVELDPAHIEDKLVGRGRGGLLDPVRFEIGAESVQSGWRYRLVEDGAELVLQVFQDDSWSDLYGFVPEPAEPVDIEVSNWFTATHPESPFVTGLFAGARRVDRCLSLFVYEQAVMIERAVGEASTATEITLDEVPALLADRFGITGVSVGPDGRLGLGQNVR